MVFYSFAMVMPVVGVQCVCMMNNWESCMVMFVAYVCIVCMMTALDLHELVVVVHVPVPQWHQCQ